MRLFLAAMLIASSFTSCLNENPYDGNNDNPVDGYINGYGYVDLGLPSGLKWATCNVGATSPEKYGDYFAWGEITTKSDYSSSNSTTYDVSFGDISGNKNYDVARANWCGTWRLPTQTEMQELVDNCAWEWTSQGWYNGYKVTGKNGKYIFLPAAGYRRRELLSRVDEYGGYWSSTPHEGNTDYASRLNFYSFSYVLSHYYRYYGYSVRPVSE